MNDKKYFDVRVIGMASFPELTAKRSFMDDPNEVPKFSVSVWITKETAEKIQAVCEEFAKYSKLPASTTIKDMHGNSIPVPGWVSPVKLAEGNKFKPENKPEYTHVIYPTSTLEKIDLFDCRGKVRQLDEGEAKAITWAGAEIVIDLTCYNKKGKNVVTLKIQKVGYRKQIMKFATREGTPFDAVEGEEIKEDKNEFESV